MPIEILVKILGFVPDTSVLLTCKKFNEICTKFNFFNLILFVIAYDFGQSLSNFFEDSVFAAMMESDRRFDSLAVNTFNRTNGQNNVLGNVIERFLIICERFGKDLKKLEFKGTAFVVNFIDFLKLMPNLTEIKLSNVATSDKRFITGKVKIQKLQKIEICDCNLNVLRLFDDLAPGTLQELSLRSFNNKIILDDVKFELFLNQLKIQKVTIDDYMINLIEWKKLKLKEINLFRCNDIKNSEFEKLLVGQSEVETFTCNGINKFSFDLICEELKSLINLEITLESVGSPQLSNLHKLKKLSIQTQESIDFNKLLSSTQNKSLETFTLDYRKSNLTEETMLQFGLNFPNIKDIKLQSKSPINVINAIIQNCQNLESLKLESNEVYGDVYNFQDGLTQKKLKNLEILALHLHQCKDLSKLIRCCENLEFIKATLPIDENFLIEIFELESNLKTLLIDARNGSKSITKITKETIKTIEKNGKKLEVFSYRPCTLIDEITPEVIMVKFRSQFKKVKISHSRWDMNKN